MRDPKRIPEILKQVEKVWHSNPGLRLGQLIIAAIKPEEPCPQIFYKEDDELLNGLQNLEKRLKKANDNLENLNSTSN